MSFFCAQAQLQTYLRKKSNIPEEVICRRYARGRTNLTELYWLFRLDNLLNLPNVTVFTCYQKEGFNILQLDLLNPKVKCFYCSFETDEIHQIRPTLVRDLSIMISIKGHY